MTKKPIALPQTGGSYSRLKSGGLKVLKAPTSPLPLGKTDDAAPADQTENKEA